MFNGPGKAASARLAHLETHLQAENPVLLSAVPTFRQLDKVLYRIGLLDREETLATRIPWWPLVTVLGTFSSGKSTFINGLLGESLQSTGNQAVDDKFTVICFGPEGQSRVLPGSALDADPRFPFYRMSHEIDQITRGEGKRIDSYLQLKTTASPFMKGKILIDSPGFDADDQRRETLRLTSHIMDLSDLVLIMFDARHPEPGAMQDTLEHLVAGTVKRPDSGKFLYILNQIDTCAREDNPEAVVAAWQRAIAQAGLTAGRFFTIYNDQAAVPIDDEALRNRFRTKRDADYAEIASRLEDVEVERQYRIISVLERVAGEIEHEMVPAVTQAMTRWRQRTIAADVLVLALILAGLLAFEVGTASSLFGTVFDWLSTRTWKGLGIVGAGVVLVLLAGHFWIRKLTARGVAASLPETAGLIELNLRAAFLKNVRIHRSIFHASPVGWGRRAMRRLQDIRDNAARHVQRLNDLYTDPSGRRREEAVKAEERARELAQAPTLRATEPEPPAASEPQPEDEARKGAAGEGPGAAQPQGDRSSVAQ